MTVVELFSRTQYDNALELGKCVVDYGASWCGPCKRMKPIYNDLAKKYTGVNFYKVDIDTLPEVSKKAGITSVPYFALYKDGVLVDRLVGADAVKLEEKLEAFVLFRILRQKDVSASKCWGSRCPTTTFWRGQRSSK